MRLWVLGQRVLLRAQVQKRLVQQARKPHPLHPTPTQQSLL
jgi:hypothetical protein